MRRFFGVFSTLTLLLSFFALHLFSQAQPVLAYDYNGGSYTNLCGSGYSASGDTCNQGCNPGSGSCSHSGNTVVSYTCDGRQGECRNNESGFSGSASVSSPGCGKTVQIDVFKKTCRVNGAWTCGDGDLIDYMVWYSGDCHSTPPPTPSPTCQNYLPVNTQFRKSGNGDTPWVNGSDISNLNLKKGATIDVNCFAQNGSSLLPGGVIDATFPDGSTSRVSSAPELRNYTLTQTGSYSFVCRSTTFAGCNDADSFVTTKIPEQQSSCDELSVVGGQNSLVPATVSFRGRGSDNQGSIARYRYYYGDGNQEESSSNEIRHTYNSSGNYTARLDVKDSQGNWKTSNSCQANVYVQPSIVESHRSGCSDLFINAGQDSLAPVTGKFTITGYDNKGGIQRYKLDFGNGIVKESEGQSFEQRYEVAGTYTLRAYVRDSDGNWLGGDSSCQRQFYVRTKPITEQPNTGTPTDITILGVTSGFIGSVLLMSKRTLLRRFGR